MASAATGSRDNDVPDLDFPSARTSREADAAVQNASHDRRKAVYNPLVPLWTKPYNYIQEMKRNMVENELINRNSIWARIAEHPLFEPACLLLIVANALWIGFEVDASDPDETDPPFGFVVVENTFCALFSMEIVFRFLAYTRRRDFFLDRIRRKWNLFDLALVMLLVAETWVIPGLGLNASEFNGLSSVRLMRLLRIVRVLRMVPELAMMVKSMLAALRSVSMTGVLAIGIMYVFSIVLAQWARSHIQIHECAGVTCVSAAFGTIPKSFLTLMQILCFDNTFALVRAIYAESLFYGTFLILFICISAFTVLNMLIGVICEIVSKTNEGERAKLMKEKIERLFKQLDTDDSGLIEFSEVRSGEAVSQLEKVGVDRDTLCIAFEIMDKDKDEKLQLDEFKDTLFKLMNPPETQDILLIQRKLEKLVEAMRTQKEQERISKDDEGAEALQLSLFKLEQQASAMTRLFVDAPTGGSGDNRRMLAASPRRHGQSATDADGAYNGSGENGVNGFDGGGDLVKRLPKGAGGLEAVFGADTVLAAPRPLQTGVGAHDASGAGAGASGAAGAGAAVGGRDQGGSPRSSELDDALWRLDERLRILQLRLQRCEEVQEPSPEELRPWRLNCAEVSRSSAAVSSLLAQILGDPDAHAAHAPQRAAE